MERQGHVDCPADCQHSPLRRQAARVSARRSAANNGPWLAPRIKHFSAWEEVYTAVLDLEEEIWRFARRGADLTDQEVVAALDYLVDRDKGRPNELGSWLEECFHLKGEHYPPEESYPPLLMLGLLPPAVRQETLLLLREIVVREAAEGRYLERAGSYFAQLARTEQSWRPPNGEKGEQGRELGLG